MQAHAEPFIYIEPYYGKKNYQSHKLYTQKFILTQSGNSIERWSDN